MLWPASPTLNWNANLRPELVLMTERDRRCPLPPVTATAGPRCSRTGRRGSLSGTFACARYFRGAVSRSSRGRRSMRAGDAKSKKKKGRRGTRQRWKTDTMPRDLKEHGGATFGGC